MSDKKIASFLSALKSALDETTFIKLSMGNYQGTELELKKILVKPVVIKKGARLSFTYRYQTRDVVKNYPYDEALDLMNEFIGSDFQAAVLFTTHNEWQLSSNKGKFFLHQSKSKQEGGLVLTHDRVKKRLIHAKGQQYLHDLKITNATGDVYKNAQDKYRQINRYIETLSKPLQNIDSSKGMKIVDMGAGKGYLTFALYDYLTNVMELKAEVTGVEYRQGLVDLCNQIAKKANFEYLDFEQGTIEDYKTKSMDVLIALHACDTATDEAIFKGITSGAQLIVVAPCCHHQIRKEIETNKAQNELDFLLKYGIFTERQAEMVTDGIRALILNYYGYSTKVFEFISDAHTPKNILIVGTKNKNLPKEPKVILNQISEVKKYFGIDKHHLEGLMKMI